MIKDSIVCNQAIKKFYDFLSTKGLENLDIELVDVEENSSILDQYKIDGIPAFLMFEDEKLIQCFIGGDEKTIKELISKMRGKIKKE